MLEFFSDPKVLQQLEIIKSEYLFATWETVYSLARMIFWQLER